LIWQALRLVWSVKPRLALLLTTLQILSGTAIGAQLLIGRSVLRELLALSQTAGGVGPILPELALLVVITVSLAVIGSVAASLQASLAEHVGVHNYDRIIEVASGVPVSYFEDSKFLDELMRARTTGMFRTIEIVNSVNTLGTAIVATVGIGAALLSMHGLLLPLVVLAGIPTLIATLINSRQAYVFEYLWTPHNRERAYLGELLTVPATAKEIRVFSANGFLKRRYDALTKERLTRFRAYLHKQLSVSLAGRLGSSLGAALALGALTWLVLSDQVDFPTAMTAAAAMQLLVGRLSAVARGIGRLVESGMFFSDYQSFLSYAAAVEAAESDRAYLPAPSFQQLSVQNVSFRYPGTTKRVLENVSVEINAGEVVALVGENGSGKTTLVKLLLQLYQPDEGRILWNGVDTRELEQETLRSELTVIFQDFIKYHLPISDNIALGRVERPSEISFIEDAARKTGAHQFIELLPRKYETRLGREFLGGHELSVGQWQRLALARAVFRGGSFLILDEPTASLDPRAEHELFAHIRELQRERSVLLISHRFSSVRTADRIYVLDSGRIIEQGTHDHLMAENGHYAELFRLQAAAYLENDARAGI
jgi:ATP-binding cassette subfamily B protein